MSEQLQQLPCPKCGRTWWWTKNTKPDEAICPPWYGCNDEPDDYDIPLEGYEAALGNDLSALQTRIEELEAENAKLKAMIADQINSTGDDPEIMAATRAEWAARAKAAEAKELEERLKATTDDAKEAEAYAEEIYAHAKELETKLAKAVEALRFLKSEIRGHGFSDEGRMLVKCNSTLAKLTGGKDD